MKVKNLMDALRSCDPEAEVVMVFQPHWPLETALQGIAVRKEFKDGDETNDDDGDEAPSAPPPRRNGEAENDVVLVQGDFLRYGSADAWNAARR